MSDRIDRARRLRRDQTDVEKKLWSHLRDRRLDGWKFRRQVPIDRYVVELDGGQHTAESDAERIRLIESCGYLVIRFWNNDVTENAEGVLLRIANTLRDRRPLTPTLSPTGRGG